jgi:hypothetical protein
MNAQPSPRGRKEYPRVWVYDINCRVYRQDPVTKRSYGSPIYREHWREVRVIGETARSWLTSCRKKIPKSGGSGISFSLEDVEQRSYMAEHAYHIGRKVGECRDYNTMKQIAEIIGYNEAERDRP